MRDNASLIESVTECIYQLYLDGYSCRHVRYIVGFDDFYRCRELLAEQHGISADDFDLIEYVLSRRPVFPVQDWELQAMKNAIRELRREKENKPELRNRPYRPKLDDVA